MIFTYISPSQDKEETLKQKKEENSEIKKKSIVQGNFLKKNPRFLKWEEYFGCLSGAYIYFYKNSQDEEYLDYFLIKDSKIELTEDSLEIILKNNFGTLNLKFPKIDKKEKWLRKLKEKINEMMINYDSKNLNNEDVVKEDKDENNLKNKNIDKYKNFGIELTIGNATFDLIDNESNYNGITSKSNLLKNAENNQCRNNKDNSFIKEMRNKFSHQKLYTFSINHFYLRLISMPFTTKVKLSIDNIKLVDNYPKKPCFQILIKNSKVFKSENKERKSLENIVENLFEKPKESHNLEKKKKFLSKNSFNFINI